MRKRLLIAISFAASAIASLSAGPANVFAAGSAARVVLHGNVSPRAKAEFDVGPSSPSHVMNRMILLLKMDTRKQAQLDQLVSEQHDPSSANYHKWLTPAQFGQKFGRTPQEIATVTHWLVSRGFTINSVSRSGTRINFSGTAADVNRAFDANMHDYRVNGHLRHANSANPSIPSFLASLVAGPVSLSSFPRRPAHTASRRVKVGGAAKPGYTVGGSGSGYLSGGYYLSPGDFAAVYNVTGVYNMGYNGQGITIAIVGQTVADTSMWAKFRSTFGLSANAPKVIIAGTSGKLVDSGQGDEEESDIDVEWAGAVAPAATIDFVSASVSDGGIDTAAQYVVDNALAPIMSLSYDLCESDLGASGNQFYANLWEQAAAEGITVFVASGDNGAYDCVDSRGNPTATRAVNGIASTPYDIAVGGTSLSSSSQYWGTANSTTDVSALSAVPALPEAAWNDWSTSGGWYEWASGGGASTTYAKPSWQACTGVPNDGRRDVPDLSLNADANGVGYLVYTCNDGSSQCASSSYGLYAFGGTSCASPSFAGIMALIEQSLRGQWQGNANSVFYQLASTQYSATSATNTVFNDITSGTNGFVGNNVNQPGYSCTSGYDQVTGLGSIDATNLVLAYQQKFGGLWQGATDYGNGWKWLSWFGYFNTGSPPWIYHEQLGWLYPFGNSPTSIWLWDSQMNSLVWTSQTVFPFVFRARDNSWLYYAKWSSPPSFYNFTTQRWETN
ncbi:MAG: S53 family peptidase [Syntrophobacteraceae bacterium]